MKFIGIVIQDRIAPGSKSERDAVFLQTESGRFILRRGGANAFVDHELNSLIGQTVKVEGNLHNGTLIAETITNLTGDS